MNTQNQVPRSFVNYDRTARASVRQILEWEGHTNVADLLESYSGEAGVPAMCMSGCMVEQDGYCPHDHPSIFIEQGVI